MLGQDNLKLQIQEYVNMSTFPRFSIIVGKRGSGKRLLGKYIANELGYSYLVWQNKIDDIRSLIKFMWEQDKPTVYCIPDYEDMSLGARNAILKVCEEPPNNAFIILTSSLKDIILPTILGRGTVFEMQGYSQEDLIKVAEINYNNFDKESINNKIMFCETPGEVIRCENLNSEEFRAFVEKLWANIGIASAGNLLKITNSIKLKDDSNGYDLDLFINSLMWCNNNSPVNKEQSDIYSELLRAKRDISLKYNKQYIVDNLLLNIRGIKNGTI